MEKEIRELAKCRIHDLEIEDHGWLVLVGHFEYEESGSCQGLGYFAHTSFIMRLMHALGVNQFSHLNGRSCWVTHHNSEIQKIEPLHKKDGKTFIIKDWQDWLNENKLSKSAHDMVYGVSKKHPKPF